MLERVGMISELKRQVPYEILPKNGKEKPIHYVPDFMYFEDGKLVAEDVKGYKTDVYRLKRKMFLYRYPEIEFRET